MIFVQPSVSLKRRYEAGKRLRARLPREDQAHWTPAADRPHPLATLARVNQGRLEKLLPEKYRRMRLSAFAFFRGAAVLMGSDLSALPQGQRVANGQQMMQTASDPFLGYTRCGGRDYLVRQLADHKAGLAPTELKGRTLVAYARLCGEVLAKGHARTSDAAILAGYVGASRKLDEAIAAFAVAYAEQTRTDYQLFVRSLRRRPGSGVQSASASAPDPRTRPR
jgi:uncharacterized protein (DUF2252 family)